MGADKNEQRRLRESRDARYGCIHNLRDWFGLAVCGGVHAMIAADNDSLQQSQEAEALEALALEALARLEDRRLFRERWAALIDACDDRRKWRMIEQMVENDK